MTYTCFAEDITSFKSVGYCDTGPYRRVLITAWIVSSSGDNLCLSDPDIITSFSCYVIPAGWHDDSTKIMHLQQLYQQKLFWLLGNNITYNPPHPPPPPPNFIDTLPDRKLSMSQPLSVYSSSQVDQKMILNLQI